MKQVTTSTRVVRSGMKRVAPNRLLELAAWLFQFNAARWNRRALFYGRYRDYFPRLSASRFVDRCRELEMTYRGFAEVMFGMSAHDQWVLVRANVVRRKHGRKTGLPTHLASISSR